MQFFMPLQTVQKEAEAKEEVIFYILLLLLFLFACFVLVSK